MKYRRRLPALMDKDGEDVEEEDSGRKHAAQIPELVIPEESSPEVRQFSRYSGGGGSFKQLPSKSPRDKTPPPDPRKIYVANISYRVTTTQLASFFSKFGRVVACSLPYEKSSGTFPRTRKSRGVGFVTFKNAEDAEKAKSAPLEAVKFYDRTMVVTQAVPPSKKRTHSFHSHSQNAPSPVPGRMSPLGRVDSVGDEETETTSQSETEPESPGNSDYLMAGGKHVNCLPDRIFVEIFVYLDLYERVKVERVCKRWQEMAFHSWSHQTRLRFTADQFSIFGIRKPLHNAILKALLHRCGRYLTSLDLSGVTATLLDEHSLAMVAGYCPMLTEVDLTGLRVRWQALKLFAENCPNLLSVAYRDASNLGEKAFWYLFRNCNNLRVVDLSGCRRLAGRCFRLLGLFLDEVVLSGCVRLEPQAVEEICLKSPNVRILRLDECCRLTDECLNMISRCLSGNLHVLSLCGDTFSKITSEGLQNLGRMDRLTELRLDNNPAVTDRVLMCVAEGCPSLEILSLVEAGKKSEEISEQGLRNLSSCSQLKEINLSYLSGVRDSVLMGLAFHGELEMVKVRGCTHFGDGGVSSLAACGNLYELDCSGCILVSNSGLDALVEAFKKEEGGLGKRTVTVTVGGTSVTRKNVNTSKLSRVVLDYSDYSSAHFCPEVKTLISSECEELDSEGDMESDDEFESLTAQRSFVLETLEEDDMLPGEDPFEEWEVQHGHSSTS